MQYRFKGINIIYLEGIGFFRLLYGRWIKVLADGKIHTKKEFTNDPWADLLEL